MPSGARTIRSLSDERFLEILEAAQDRSLPDIRARIERAFLTEGRGFSVGGVERAIRQGGIEGIFSDPAWTRLEASIVDALAGPDSPIVKTAERAAREVMGVMPGVDADRAALVEIRERVRRMLLPRAREVARGIVENSQLAVARIASEAMELDGSKAWLRLTKAQRATRVLFGSRSGLRLGLGMQEVKGFMERVGRSVTRYAGGARPLAAFRRRLARIEGRRRRRRMERIAANETLQAANAAMVETYGSLSLDGAIEGDMVLEWVAREIGACPRCRAFDGSTREITGGLFVSDGSGPKGVETASYPEIHPNGYCTVRLIPRSKAKRTPADSLEPITV